MRGISKGINQGSDLNAVAGYNALAKITYKHIILIARVAKVSLLTEKGQCIHPLRQFTTMISGLTIPLSFSPLLVPIFNRYPPQPL
jgi:hypothetical protein